MVLENFLVDADILWDRAGKELYEKPEARAGRKMRVRVTNRGVIEDLTGFTLNLGWTSTKDETKFGLDAFDAVDATKGIFEIEYTSGMLTNIGTLKAALQLVPTVGNTVESNNFVITVTRSAVDTDAIQSESSFTALTSALVEVQGWNDRIDVVEQEFIDKANNLDATYPTRLVSVEQQLEQAATKTALAVEKARIDSFTTLASGSTTGDAELIDGRLGADAVTYPNIGGAIRGQLANTNNNLKQLNLVTYLHHNFTDGDTHEYGVNIPTSHKGSLCLSISNSSASSGYGEVKFIYGTNLEYKISESIAANSKQVYKDIPITHDLTSIRFQNVNARNSFDFIVYESFFDTFDKVIDMKSNYTDFTLSQTGAEINKNYGYINAVGSIATATSGNNQYSVVKNVLPNSKFAYSGSQNNWDAVFGVKADNSIVTLLVKGTYTNQIINVPDDVVELRAWADSSVGALSLKYVTPNERILTLENLTEITVDANGNGMFTDIQTAINYAKNNYDVNNIPVTIVVKNGVYTVSPTAVYPFYAINKGANKISIKGESRDGTIINCLNTPSLKGVALNIGGECTIEGMTINVLADGALTATDLNGANYRPYCLHNDNAPSDTSKAYYTTIKNCKFYDEVYTPVGAGLQHNQTQRYEDCECIYNSLLANDQGAMYIHAPSLSTDVANGVEIVDCVAVSQNGATAIHLPNVSGSQTYATIKQTFVRNVTATTGPAEIWNPTPNKTITSKGNSNVTLNHYPL